MRYINAYINLLLAVLLGGTASRVHAQDASFMILGDMHLDKFELHDMDYVRTRPQDFAQISREYPFFTATYTPHLLNRAKELVAQSAPPLKAIVQLGDLMQGVAGNDKLSREMGRFCVDMLYETQNQVPWILTKGNHDVSTSPGQPEAWREVVLPFIERQINTQLPNGMYTYRLNDDIQFFVLEQFFSPDQHLPESAILEFLKEELSRSTATYKFLLTHQPVIPVTERCWHLFSGIRRPLDDYSVRDEFLELLAQHRVVVLCAHLHKYAKITRSTPKGPVVQFMFNSVISSYDAPQNPAVTTRFPARDNMDPAWQPHTLEKRAAILDAEKPFIQSYYSEESSGYGVITWKEGNLMLNYYRGTENLPSDVVHINNLYK